MMQQSDYNWSYVIITSKNEMVLSAPYPFNMILFSFKSKPGVYSMYYSKKLVAEIYSTKNNKDTHTEGSDKNYWQLSIAMNY